MGSKRWQGQTIAVVASGPSLSKKDCDLIQRAGLPTVAVNHSWKLARFCNVLYAGDACWWDAYGAEADIPAERWTCTSQAAHKHGINLHKISGSYNSGSRAIQFAIEQGATRVVLLGFDCSLDDGIHWHGPHDKTKNPDKSKVRLWHRYFRQVATQARARNVEVVNCSRTTALSCFLIRDLEIVLAEHINRHVALEGQSAISA